MTFVKPSKQFTKKYPLLSKATLNEGFANELNEFLHRAIASEMYELAAAHDVIGDTAAVTALYIGSYGEMIANCSDVTCDFLQKAMKRKSQCLKRKSKK